MVNSRPLSVLVITAIHHKWTTSANCVIEITGNSKLSNIRGGMAAPAIGAGYHQGRLEGFIDGSVELDKDTVKAGDNWADMDFYALTF